MFNHWNIFWQSISQGNERWVEALSTDFSGEYKKAKSIPWVTNNSGKVAGEVRTAGGSGFTAGNVTFVNVYDAGWVTPIQLLTILCLSTLQPHGPLRPTWCCFGKFAAYLVCGSFPFWEACALRVPKCLLQILNTCWHLLQDLFTRWIKDVPLFWSSSCIDTVAYLWTATILPSRSAVLTFRQSCPSVFSVWLRRTFRTLPELSFSSPSPWNWDYAYRNKISKECKLSSL